MASTPGTISLSLENEVVYTNNAKVLFGVYGDQSGWLWDRRPLSVEAYAPTTWDTTFGPESWALLEGSALEDWTAGVVEGLDFDHMKVWSIDDTTYWTPVYKTGSFALHWDVRNLYSDYSYSQLAEDQTTGAGFYYLDLDSNARWNSLSVRMYTRGLSGRRLTFRNWDLVEEFTTEFVGSTRPTVDPVTTSDVSTRHWEYRIDDSNNRLEFNQSPFLSVGTYISPLDADEIRHDWENGGLGSDDGKYIFLKHFPVLQDTVKVVSIDSGGVVTELTQVDRLWDSEPTDAHFSVDRDLGVIQLGGYKAPNLVLAADISAIATEVLVLPSKEEFDSWPDGGIALIGSEQIKYRGKGHRRLLNCVRGYNSTTATTHSKYDEIEHHSTGAAVDPADEVWIKYVATPRVEYEVTDYGLRTANGSWLNVHPLVVPEPRRISQIQSLEKNIASLTLSASAPAITNSLYGPIYYGTDVTLLTATAYDALGNPVDDVEITIELVDGPGVVGGAGSTFTDTSNVNGQIYALYSTSNSFDQIEMEAIPSHSGSDTEFAVADLKGVPEPDKLWIYQVIKNDPIAGTVGKEVVAANPPSGGWSVPGTALFNESSQFLIRMQHTDEYGRPPEMPIENYDLSVDGASQIVVLKGGVLRRYNVLWSTRDIDSSGNQAMRFGVDSATDPALDGTETIWILGPKDTEYVDGGGTRVILYKWYTGGEYAHPLTGVAASLSAPVAAPIHPDSVAPNLVTVSGYNFPIGDKTDRTNNLAGYVVVGPGRAELRATAVDPYSGTLIESNHIFLGLELPIQLVGVDETGVLPVPSGWKLPTEDYNLGAGLGAANFLTVNPSAQQINRFTLTGAV